MDAVSRTTAFYFDTLMPRLLRAIVQAEGGQQAFLRAIRCSFPLTHTYTEALARGCKTLRSRAASYCDFCQPRSARGSKRSGAARRTSKATTTKQDPLGSMFTLVPWQGTDPFTQEDNPRRLCFSDDFLRFVGATWAPIGATNDPTNLNQYWVQNVTKLYHEECRKA